MPKLNGQDAAANAAKVTVVADALSSGQSTVSVAADRVKAGESTTVTLIAKMRMATLSVAFPCRQA